jgi:hypothetical protein
MTFNKVHGSGVNVFRSKQERGTHQPMVAKPTATPPLSIIHLAAHKYVQPLDNIGDQEKRLEHWTMVQPALTQGAAVLSETHGPAARVVKNAMRDRHSEAIG